MRNSTKFVLSLAMAFCLVGMAKAQTPSSKVYVKNWTAADAAPYSYWSNGCDTGFPNLEGHVLNIKASAVAYGWDTQVQVATGIPTIIGNDYTVRLRMQGSEDGKISCAFGDWEGKDEVQHNIDVPTTMQNVDIHYTNAKASDSWVIVWAGSYAGTLSIASVEVYCNSLLFYSYDYTGKNEFPWYHGDWGEKPTVNDELTATNLTELGHPTNYMFFVADNIYTEEGKDYIVRAKIKGDGTGTIGCNFGTWGQSVTEENLSLTNKYQDVTVHFTGLPTADNSHVIFHIGKYVGTVSLKKIEVLAYVPENISVTAAGYATYSSSNALDLANISGGTAYIVADQANNGSVPLTEINTAVPANTGLLIKCEGGGTVTIPVAASGEAPATNYLVASDGTTEVGINNYVFAYENGEGGTTLYANPGFYKLESAVTVSKGKAYLSSGVIPPGAKANYLPFKGTATEVVAPEVAETEEDEVLYNMAGIQVDKNFKGIVINQKGVKRFNR